MGNKKWQLLCCAAAMTLLAGCGGGSEGLPETYVLGEESLPALGEAQGVTSDSAVSCTVTTDEETGATTYAYSGLTSGQETAQAYLQTLREDYGCSPINETGVRLEDAAVSEEEGQLLVGRDAADGAGILEIALQWGAEDCQLTASILEGQKIRDPETSAEPIGITAAVEQLEDMPPTELGQPEGTYTAFADDGYILVDDDVCYRLNLYGSTAVDTPEIVGTYLLSLDGQRLYRVDRETGEAVQLDNG